MAKKRKKTRKELLKEPDEFMTISGKLIGFAVDHKNQLTYALGIIVALALIFSGISFFFDPGGKQRLSVAGKKSHEVQQHKSRKASRMKFMARYRRISNLFLTNIKEKRVQKLLD